MLHAMLATLAYFVCEYKHTHTHTEQTPRKSILGLFAVLMCARRECVSHLWHHKSHILYIICVYLCISPYTTLVGRGDDDDVVCVCAREERPICLVVFRRLPFYDRIASCAITVMSITISGGVARIFGTYTKHTYIDTSYFVSGAYAGFVFGGRLEYRKKYSLNQCRVAYICLRKPLKQAKCHFIHCNNRTCKLRSMILTIYCIDFF